MFSIFDCNYDASGIITLYSFFSLHFFNIISDNPLWHVSLCSSHEPHIIILGSGVLRTCRVKFRPPFRPSGISDWLVFLFPLLMFAVCFSPQVVSMQAILSFLDLAAFLFLSCSHFRIDRLGGRDIVPDSSSTTVFRSDFAKTNFLFLIYYCFPVRLRENKQKV